MIRKLLVASFALAVCAAVQPADARPVPRPHGPPDTFPKAPVMCAIPKRAGGGSCIVGPFKSVGEQCLCASPRGQRLGIVVWR